MDQTVIPCLLQEINRDLLIPLKQLKMSEEQHPSTCHALLSNRWISHLSVTGEYSTPPAIELEPGAISCFLMPSVFTNLPQGWNSFTIGNIDKQQLLAAHHSSTNDYIDSIFPNLIQLKCNLKLRDRQLLASCYSSAPSSSYSQHTSVDKKFLESHFCCKVIQVPVDIRDSELSGDTPPSHPTTSPHLSHILPTYFILETEKRFYLIHPHSKVTLLDAVRYSPALLSSSRIKTLFLLYQLRYCLEHISGPPTRQDSLNLSSFYLDCNLWLYSSDVDAPPAVELMGSEKRDETVNSRASLLQNSTLLWQECQMTNLDYLMLINEFAGRKMGDPNNHPFLPWVSDFKSPDSNLRDLTKSKYRLTKGDAQLDFTYTSPTYSSINVESRMEPHHVTDTFSEITYFIYLARRTPRSILCRYVRPRWEPSEYPTSVTRIQEWTPDECIPEFFIDPTVFRSIHPDLPDLHVPDWSDSPESFVAWHRATLESNHVSASLHNWIDLYFGYKLSGEAALKAKNVPHFLTKRHGSPYNYGINQLFKQPHPRKHVSNCLQQYYAGGDMKFPSEPEPGIRGEFCTGGHKSSLISIELNKQQCTTNSSSELVDPDVVEDVRCSLYDSSQMEHFDVVQVPPADFTEPLIKRPDDSKRVFSDFEGAKAKHFPFTSIFRVKTDMLDETQMLKYRSDISIPRNLDLGRLLDEFEGENLFFSSPSISQQSSDIIPAGRNESSLLYQLSYNSLDTQIVLVVLSLELLASDQLKSYPFTAHLPERIRLLRALIRDQQILDVSGSKGLITLLDTYIKNSTLHKSVTIEFPIQFPSYFEPLHVFLSEINSHKSSLLALSHIGARSSFNISDYSSLLSLVQSDSTALLSRVPQEGLHLIGDYCKWMFTDSLLGPLAFLEVFPSIASHLPTSYLLQNYISCIQKIYCDLKDHPLYPFLFQRSFIFSLITLFGPHYYFSVLLKYLLKTITSTYSSTPTTLSLVSDCLSQLHLQHDSAPDKPLERPAIFFGHSDSEEIDLLNDAASSLLASDSFKFLFVYFGIAVSTKLLLKELMGLLPDYSCKVLSHITSFELFHGVFLCDTCFVTIHSILKQTNDKYATFVCYHFMTSWIAQIQKRVLNLRTEGFLSAVVTIANIWLFSVANDNIQTTLYPFFKEIVDVLYQVISSASSLFTRGVEFRYHLHIALLHLITELISSGIEPHNLSFVKTAVLKILDAFSAFQLIREQEPEVSTDTTDSAASSKQRRINSQLLTTFNADLLSHFCNSIRNFLQDNDIEVPAFVTIYKSDNKISIPVFGYRTELQELVSLFYPSNTDISSNSANSAKPTWFLPSRPVSSTLYTDEPAKHSTDPLSPNQNYSIKSNWIDYLKQTNELSHEPKVFTYLQSLHGSEAPISMLCHTPCENIIFGSSREQVLAWRLSDSFMQSEVQASSVYKQHTKPVKSLSYINCCDNVASNDGCIHVWSAESLHNSYRHAHLSKQHQVHCTSPQTQRVIYSASNESTLTVLDTRVPRLVYDWVIPSSQPPTFHHITVTTDDHTIYLATSSGSVIMVEIRMGHILGQWSVSDADISYLLLHQNQLFSASSDNTLKILSLKGQLYQTVSCRNQTDYMESLTDTSVICSSYSDTAVTLFQRQDTWVPTHKWTIPKLNYSSIHSIVFLPLQQFLLASLEVGLVKVYGTHFTHIVSNLK